jgi:glutathione S-transferase
MTPTHRITLVQFPGVSATTTMSPPCGKVHMALRFKRLAYKVKNVRSPREARRFNPRGRVPALILDDETIVDSTDILTALDARFPDPPLQPEGPMERAHVKMLEDWADEVLYFYGVFTRFMVSENFRRLREEIFSKLPVPLRWVVPPIAQRILRRRLVGQGVGLKAPEVVRREMSECIGAVATLLESGPWLVGTRLSRADLAVCACLDQYRVARLTPELASEIESHKSIVDWAERVHEVAPAAC